VLMQSAVAPPNHSLNRTARRRRSPRRPLGAG